jgi:hypothetical protein
MDAEDEIEPDLIGAEEDASGKDGSPSSTEPTEDSIALATEDSPSSSTDDDMSVDHMGFLTPSKKRDSKGRVLELTLSTGTGKGGSNPKRY